MHALGIAALAGVTGVILYKIFADSTPAYARYAPQPGDPDFVGPLRPPPGASTAEDIEAGIKAAAKAAPDVVKAIDDIFGDDIDDARARIAAERARPSTDPLRPDLYNWTPEILVNTARTNPGFLDYLLETGQISPSDHQNALAHA